MGRRCIRLPSRLVVPIRIASFGKTGPVIANSICHCKVVLVPEVTGFADIVKDKGKITRMIGPCASWSAGQVEIWLIGSVDLIGRRHIVHKIQVTRHANALDRLPIGARAPKDLLNTALAAIIVLHLYSCLIGVAARQSVGQVVELDWWIPIAAAQCLYEAEKHRDLGLLPGERCHGASGKPAVDSD